MNNQSMKFIVGKNININSKINLSEHFYGKTKYIFKFFYKKIKFDY